MHRPYQILLGELLAVVLHTFLTLLAGRQTLLLFATYIFLSLYFASFMYGRSTIFRAGNISGDLWGFADFDSAGD